MSKQIGPRMSDVCDYVARHPGCSKLAAAEYVAPNGSRRYGYRTVDRAMDAGIVWGNRVQGVYRLFSIREGAV